MWIQAMVSLDDFSLFGLLATLVNQLTMYVFSALVEAPHVAAVLRRTSPLDKEGAPIQEI